MLPYATYYGIAEVLVGFSIIAPTIIRLIPPLNKKFLTLTPKDQNLFLRKIVSILHCWIISAAVLYLQFNPEHCQNGWSIFSAVWVGFLSTDLLLSILTGTSSAGAGCLAFKVLKYRYYADLFNQNSQLRLMLAMLGYKNTELYRINSVIATAGFFCVRILIIPVAWWHFWLHRIELYEFTFSSTLYYATIILLILSDLQNIDWFSRMYKSTKRNLSSAKTEKQTQ